MEIKIFKQKKSFHKGNFLNQPNFFWMLLLCMMAVIIIASFFLFCLIFFRVNDDPVLPAGSFAKPVETVDRERLQETIDYFSQRETVSNEILSNSKNAVDPSL